MSDLEITEFFTKTEILVVQTAREIIIQEGGQNKSVTPNGEYFLFPGLQLKGY